MFDRIKKLFKKKEAVKEAVKEVEEKIIVIAEDATFENEVKKSAVKETKETKSSLTFGV
jgi:hypothetical protein|tara:strand:- start:171 stop:347 length:177 start_codon:yes stop_codon:yes gene_type:complete